MSQITFHCCKELFKALGNGLEMYGSIKDWDNFKIKG